MPDDMIYMFHDMIWCGSKPFSYVLRVPPIYMFDDTIWCGSNPIELCSWKA